VDWLKKIYDEMMREKSQTPPISSNESIDELERPVRTARLKIVMAVLVIYLATSQQ
jgi:hypothetical protein